MRRIRTRNIAWIVFALLIGAAVFWWTSIKNHVVKKAVTNAVQKKTDSLYRISYERSDIDEVAGNAYLYNVQVKIDSTQWLQLVEKDSMPPVTLSVTIAKVTIKGLSEIKLLSNSSLDVTSIVLEKPVLRLDRWAPKRIPPGGLNDTMEIYKRLVGNFDFLRAKSIQVVDGNFTLIDQFRRQALAANGININIDDFLADSLHNYRNILSYFIKQTRATVDNVSSTRLQTGSIEYDSKQQILNVKDLRVAGEEPVTVKELGIKGLSTEAFISNGHVNAKSLVLKTPAATIKPTAGKKDILGSVVPVIALDSLVIQKGNFNVYTKKNKLISIKDLQLLLKNVKTINGNLPIEDYLNSSNCMFSVASIKLPVKLHNIHLQNVLHTGNAGQVRIGSLQVNPAVTRQQLKARIGRQEDMYTVNANNIIINKIDFKKLIKDNTVSIQDISLQMNFHVFEDKTVQIDSGRQGRSLFPYDAIRTSKTKIDIRTINIRDSKITYEEQAPKSGMNGTVFFTAVNGRLTNITNIPSQLAKDNAMKLEAAARVMDLALLKTNWQMLLNAADANFKVTGNVSPFPASILSRPFEALNMMSIRSGFTDKLDFEINGNHTGSTGTVLLNYHDLKVDVLKKNNEDSLTKKGFASFLANADIRNRNESKKPKEFHYTKDRYKSFFNLLWKSIFEGGKNTILIIK
ncbi:MAG: hypothetical protein V4539_04650 [Bacteroidota bacterium]